MTSSGPNVASAGAHLPRVAADGVVGDGLAAAGGIDVYMAVERWLGRRGKVPS